MLCSGAVRLTPEHNTESSETLALPLVIQRSKLSREQPKADRVLVEVSLLWTSFTSSSNTPGRVMQLKLE